MKSNTLDFKHVTSKRRSAAIMSAEQKTKLPAYMQRFIDYRKSGLSLNHVIGCSLDCGYCVRHFWGNFDMKIPQLLCSNEEAVTSLLHHKFFVPHKTPIQLFNKATDPFLPSVREHTHTVLQKLDEEKLTNMVLIITRAQVTKEDMEFLESLRYIKVSLFFTYSAISDPRIEPISRSEITINSIKLASQLHRKVKLILYWRPIVPTWNDDRASMVKVLEMGQLVDAIVFTGYYHRKENNQYLQSLGVKIPYTDTEVQRRKVLPIEIEKKILSLHQELGIKTPLFRKTSCGAAFAHSVSDYNGHWSIQEICDICPLEQRERCRKAHNVPTHQEIKRLLTFLEGDPSYEIEKDHLWTKQLGEERRYYIQHALNFQTWDIDWPHFCSRHGRSPLGYTLTEKEKIEYEAARKRFLLETICEDE